MNRPGKVIKASTIDDLPKKHFKDFIPLVTITVRLTKDNNDALKNANINTGYSQQDIINMALKEYLKLVRKE